MAFRGILYEEGGDRARGTPAAPPDYFRDLNLDQIVQEITADKEAYDLRPLFL